MKNIAKVSLLGLSLAALPAPLLALGIHYKPWFVEPQGEVRDGGRSLQLREDLGLEPEYSGGWLLATSLLDLSFNPMDFSGTRMFESSASFGPATFADGAVVRTEVEIDDLAARYLWHPWPSLGIGLLAKWLDAEILLEEVGEEDDGGGLLGGLFGGGEPNRERETFSEVFPMLALSADVPLFGYLTLRGDGAYVRYDDDEILEYDLSIGLQGERLALRLGWLEKRYDLADGGFVLDARAKGLYAQLGIEL